MVTITEEPTPATTNSLERVQRFRELMDSQVVKDRFLTVDSGMGGEDFGRFRLRDPSIRIRMF